MDEIKYKITYYYEGDSERIEEGQDIYPSIESAKAFAQQLLQCSHLGRRNGGFFYLQDLEITKIIPEIKLELTDEEKRITESITLSTETQTLINETSALLSELAVTEKRINAITEQMVALDGKLNKQGQKEFDWKLVEYKEKARTIRTQIRANNDKLVAMDFEPIK